MEKLSLETSDLGQQLEKAKKDFHAAISNAFDTPQAMQIISGIIKDANIHIKEAKGRLDLPAIEAVARWVTKLVGILGLDGNASPPYDGLGWASATVAADQDPATAIQPYASVFDGVVAAVKGFSLESDTVKTLLEQNPKSDFDSLVAQEVREVEQLALPYLRAVSRIRDELRRLVGTFSADLKKQVLVLTDRIRDEDLTNLGVYLDDRPDGQPSLVKFVPAQELIAEREKKAAAAAEKIRQKEEARKAREREAEEKEAKARVNPRDMFRDESKYSAWDEEGLPTKLVDGGDVPKSQLKKLQKEWQKQRKAYDEIMAKEGGKS
jgi:cysteinyl-tRNA synthetase